MPAIEEFFGKDTLYKGGVLNSKNKFIEESATKRDSLQRSLIEGYKIEKSPKYKDETVIYGGVLYELYGHVLLESLSRLWYYINHNPERYRIVFDLATGASGKFKEFFELLDIPYNNETFITEPTQYKKVIVPEQSYYYGGKYHKDWLIPIHYMLNKVKSKKEDKIFFSRLKLKRNPLLNEKQICNIFKKNGYKIVYPELLALKDQIAYLKGAKEFVTWAGTLAVQAAFCKDGTKRIILNRAIEPDNKHRFLEQIKNLPTIHIDCSLNPLPVSHIYGPWIVGLTAQFIEFCKDFKLKFSGKQGVVHQRFLLMFYQGWKYVNNIKRIDDITYEELYYLQNQIKIKTPLSLSKICLMILKHVTFGKLHKRIKNKIEWGFR